jgi:hypothetical protein
VTVAAVSSELSGFLRLASNVVSGVGLDGSGNRSVDPSTMWLNTGNGNYGGPVDSNPYIEFDLGGLYNVSSISVYNYNEVNYTARGVSSFDLLGSTDGVTFNDLGIETLQQAPGTATNFVQTLSVLDQVRYVKFANLTAFSGDDNNLVGLGSVAFGGTAASLATASAVPEPGSLAILAFSLVGILAGRYWLRTPTA